MSEAPSEGWLTCAALLEAPPHVLGTALSPRHVLDGRLRGDAGHSEHGQVDAGVVAASFLAGRTRGLLGVGGGDGSVDDPGGDAAGPVLQPGVDEAGAN